MKIAWEQSSPQQTTAVKVPHLHAGQERGRLWKSQAHASLEDNLRAEVSGVLLEGDHSALRLQCALIYCGLDGCCVVALAIADSPMLLQLRVIYFAKKS